VIGARTLVRVLASWYWILAAGLLFAAVVTGLLAIRPTTYVASVDVVPNRGRTEVNFNTGIETVSPNGANGQTAVASAMTAERRQALVQLARSPDVEAEVRRELDSKLPPELRQPGALLQLITARTGTRSEIITIDVGAAQKDLAEQVVASWGRAYERYVNDLYASNGYDDAQLAAEVAAAERAYQGAQDRLSRFVSTSPISKLGRELEERQKLVSVLIQARDNALGDLYKVSHRVGMLLAQAEALQDQFARNSDAAGSASGSVALSLLKAQAFASSMTLPSSLQIQIPTGASQASGGEQVRRTESLASTRELQEWALPANMQIQLSLGATNVTAAQLRADAASTVAALREWRSRLDSQIQSTYTEATSGDAQQWAVLGELDAEIRVLRARVEEQAAQEKRLQFDTEVAWQSFSTVARKVGELKVGSMVGGDKEVTLATKTVIAYPKSKRTTQLAPLAAIIGAMVTAAAIALRDGYGVLSSGSYRATIDTYSVGAETVPAH
jgi:hypothetical protein